MRKSVIHAFVRCLLLASLAAFTLIHASAGLASTTARLPASACATPASIFRADFESVPPRYVEPSGGSGGTAGHAQHTIEVAGLGQKTYYAYVPTDAGDHALPLLLVLHGTAGNPGAAFDYARLTRDGWATLAEQYRFALLAPVASGGSGSWLLPADYASIRAAIDDLAARHDIDRSRLYGWGFSAGGHVMHDLVLDTMRPGLDLHAFAGYAVNAGVFAGLACGSALGCDARLASMPRQLPVAIQVGVSDPLLAYARSDHAVFVGREWQPLLYRELPIGHTYRNEDLERAWRFLCPFQRLP